MTAARIAGTVALVIAVAGCGNAGSSSHGSGASQGNAGVEFLVVVSRPAGGIITSADGQIECGSAAAATRCGPARYRWTAQAILTATADADMMFGTWAGDCTGRGPCVLDTTAHGADKTVAAVFGDNHRVQHANWMDPALHGPEYIGFVGETAEYFDCNHCHGSALDGLGIAPSCNDCHARAGHGDWQTDCTFCHGAPPATTGHSVVPRENPPALQACAFCHSSTVSPDGAILAGGGHMNGRLDVAAGAGGAGCASCHGAPPATGAHLAHTIPAAPPPAYGDTRPLGCGNCHPADLAQHGSGAQVLAQDVVLPGGTRTAGAAMSGTGMSVTCVVACHFPLGALQPAAAFAWASAGPLACRDCHSKIMPADLGGNPSGQPPAGPSLHDPPYADGGEATTCASCHDSAAHRGAHLTGDPGLRDSTWRDAACVACHTPPPGPTGPSQVLHRGSGAAYEEKTPIPLAGWNDAVSGDFHGARAGTGFGGTLAAPFARGQGPLPCSSCHASHASGNSFKIAAIVNGSTIPAGTISRAGQGAESLCKACHLGQNHGGCMGSGNFGACHQSDPQPPGSPCFMCHGHEGIRHFPSYDPGGVHDEPSNGRDCSHCHSPWAPTPQYGGLTFTATPQTSALTASSVTVAWNTSRPATTWLEYGIGTAGFVRGDSAEVGAHSVTLTGLAPSTTYVWRVRSEDASRNVVHSETRTFTTTSAQAVPAPDLRGTTTVWDDASRTGTATLRWSAVSAPSGTSLQYEVQVASDGGFTQLRDSTLGRADASLATGNSGWMGATQFDVPLTNLPLDDCSTPEPPVNTYYFRVRARDAMGNVSAWSATGAFAAGIPDPYGC